MVKPKVIELTSSQKRLYDAVFRKIKRREAILMSAFKEMADDILDDVLRLIRDELAVTFGMVDLSEYKFNPELKLFEIKRPDVPLVQPPIADDRGGCPAGVKLED